MDALSSLYLAWDVLKLEATVLVQCVHVFLVVWLSGVASC